MFWKIVTAHTFLRAVCDMPGYQQENKSDTAWGALVYGQAQSSGFARAMKVLCDAIGIECYYVRADQSAHNPDYRWNVVRAGGKYYIVDAYGNDRYETYNMYMVSDATFARWTAMKWDRNSVPACLEDLPGAFRYDDEYGPENVDVYGVSIVFPYTRIDSQGWIWYNFGDGWITAVYR